MRPALYALLLSSSNLSRCSNSAWYTRKHTAVSPACDCLAALANDCKLAKALVTVAFSRREAREARDHFDPFIDFLNGDAQAA